MSEFSWPVGISSQVNFEPRVLRAQYNGGYSQTLADGPNNTTPIWPVVMNCRNHTIIAAIAAFLKSKKGAQSFTWTPPSPLDTEIRVKCAKWNFNWSTGGDGVAFSAEFEEVTA